MNHRFIGRTWSDNPEPEKLREDKYTIERVSLLVAKGASRGRWEAYTNSRPLLSRLYHLGLTSGLKLAGMAIAGQPIPPRQASGLSLYLSSNRWASFPGSTRTDLAALLAIVGIKYHTYVPKPSSEVSAGRSHPQRA